MLRYKELKKENETLKAELESLETGREELQGRLEDLAAQLVEAEDKVADLQRLADQSRSLKDEVDILRETSDKVLLTYLLLVVYQCRGRPVAVLQIHDILGWIRIRIRGSMPLTNGSGSGSWIRILLFSSLTFKMTAKN